MDGRMVKLNWLHSGINFELIIAVGSTDHGQLWSLVLCC